MRNNLQQLLFLLFLCPIFSIHGQNYIPDTKLYGIKDGLSHRQVNDVLEDRRGYIWVATASGLNRFDGYSFRVFGREDGLLSDQIEYIFEDAYGLIWVFYPKAIGTIELIDPLSNRVFTFADKYGDKIPDGCQNKVGKPILTKDSTLYWSDNKGFMTFHPKRGYRAVTMPILGDSALFTINFVSAQQTVWGIIEWSKTSVFDHNNVVEVDAQGTILQRIERRGGQIFYVHSGKSSDTEAHHYNLLGSEDRNTVLDVGCVRVSADNKTTFMTPAQLLPASPYAQYLTTYTKLNGSNLLFSDLRIFDSDAQKMLFDILKTYPEATRDANAFLVDRSEKVWIGLDFGLLLVNIHQNRFKRLLFDAPNTRKGISCRSILEKDNQLIVNTEGAIFTGNKATGVFQKMPNTFETNARFNDKYWYGLSSDKSGNLLAVGEYNLFRLSTEGAFKHELLTNNIYVPWTIYADNQQRVWMGSFRNGLSLYDLTTKQPLIFDKYNGFNELKSAGIVNIQADQNGQIWLSATTGFYKFDLERGILERHWTGGKGAFYLPYDNIYHFYEDKDGVFWLATGGGGLIKWTPKTGKTQQFSKKAGLPNNTVYAVYEDDHAHLWLPSDYGIIQFDKVSGTVRRVYLVEDGITNVEFNRISHYRGADGTLYFGGLNGVTAFNPNDFYEKEGAAAMALVVTNFQQFDGNNNQLTDKTGDLLATNEIILKPNDRFFNLEFALLSFNQSDKIQYAYKIDGIDADWNYQNEPRLRLSRLPYGTHTLHIRGQAANGLWGSNDLTIKIHVLRPFYLQFWFILLSIGAILMSIRLLFKWRTRDLQKNQVLLKKEVALQTEKIQGQTEELRQLDTLKTQLYTNITHEFRTPLTVIMGMTDNITGHENERNLIQRNSHNLLRLINQLLDLSKLDSGTLQADVVQADIINYLQYLTESFYSMAKEKQINLTFYAETKALLMDFDESKIQHVLYNLLSNALKFTQEGGKVVIHAVKIEQNGAAFLKLNVQDTGIGLATDELPRIFDRFYQADNSSTRKSEGTGIGLALTKELIEWMGGKINVESTVGKGTTFTILLPIKNAAALTQIRPLNGLDKALIEENTPHEDAAILLNLEEENGKPQLLIIEDNRDVVFYMQSILQDIYTIRIAKNGQEGIEKAFDTIPDIIISDVMMPEKNGYEVCEMLKNDARTSHIPIILLTAKSTVDDKITGLKVGADAYLMKPFHKEELLVRLDKLLALRRVLQQQNAVAMLKTSSRFETSTTLADISTEKDPSVFLLNDKKMPILTKTTPSLDDIFLQKIQDVIHKRLNDSNLGIVHLCKAVNLSHTQVFRKLKAITGDNPTLYIRKLRLQRAAHLLQTTELNVSEIAYETGFSDPSYFSRAFHEEFGTPPSALRK